MTAIKDRNIILPDWQVRAVLNGATLNPWNWVYGVRRVE